MFIAKNLGKVLYPLSDEWISKMWYLHTTEYYFVMKTDQLESFVRKWLHFGTIVLSEINQAHRLKYLTVCRRNLNYKSREKHV